MTTIPSARDFFSKHAKDYTKSDSHAHGSDLSLLVELLQPRSTELVLDVATGTGFTAIELAKKVKQVIAIDITDEMLSEASRLANERKISNIHFEKADANSLPYDNESFDIVTTRRAAHHFTDVSKFLNEAHRVLKVSGRLAIVDMSPLNGTEEFLNRIERLRDSTHIHGLTQSQWKDLVKGANLSIAHIQIIRERIDFEHWLYPVNPGGREEKQIKEEWRRASLQIRNTLDLYQNQGTMSWIKTRIVLIAKKL